MPDRSALARLQRLTTFGLIGLTLAWLCWHWQRSPAVAIGGALAILLCHSFFLLAELVLLKIIGRNDPAPRPTIGDLVRAWWVETWMAFEVFYWRQPFRWRAEPDFAGGLEVQGKRGVVLVHGFVCNRGFWNPWMERLRAEGLPFVAVNLEPVFGSIDDYAEIIETAVRRITEATGKAPLVVGHSMGGLALRAWMRTKQGSSRVHGLVTIGTPHRGTWLGRFSRVPNGRQMRLGGEWVRALDAGTFTSACTCWYSNCDNVVFPPASATLSGADNRLVQGAAHVELAFRPCVLAHVMERLREQG